MTAPPATAGLARHGERKFAVLMFVDLTGYTALCRRLDPEDVAATIHPLMHALRETVSRSGGVIASTAGDGFMAVYGVPVAVPDAGDRAARAAVDMRAHVAARRRSPGSVQVPEVHIGCAAGEVLVSPSDDSPGWSLIGTAVNLASRLCDRAGPGEILVDDQMRALLPGLTPMLHQREVQVQGHDEPVVTWSLTDPPQVPMVPDSRTPFVNRVAERTLLTRALETVASMRVSAVFRIGGEAGIGKSRLIEHWLREDAGARWVWLRSDRGALSNAVVQLLHELVSLTGLPAEDVLALLADADDRQDLVGDHFPSLLNAVRERLAVASADQPLVLVLDDVQDSDPAVLDLVADLDVRPVQGRLLTVVLWRHDEADLGPEPDLTVEPLAPDDAMTLFEAALGAAVTDDGLAALARRASGHPLMALQSAAFLRESDLVQFVDGTCRVRNPERLEVLPGSLRLFVAARIDRLPVAQKTILQQLSTCGESVDVDSARLLLGEAAETFVAPLISRRLLTEDGPGSWTFAHSLIRDVAYSTLPRRQRAALHADLLANAGDAGRRAFHAQRWFASVTSTDAEETARAAAAAIRETRVLAQSLHATRSRSAYAAARRVVDLLEDHAGHAPADSVSLLTLIGNCLLDLGRFDDALSTATRAERLTRDLGADTRLVVRALLIQGDALSRLRRYQSARQVLDEAVRVAESAGDDVGAGLALRLLGDTYRHSDSSQLLALTERAHAVLTKAGDEPGAAVCAQTLAFWLSTSPSDRYERWLDEASALTDDEDVRGQLWIARARSYATMMRMRPDEAITEATRCRRLGELVGATEAVTDGLLVGIEACTYAGDLATALQLREELVELATETANSRTRVMAAVVGVLALVRSGELAAAGEELALIETESDAFGVPEKLDTLVARAMVARDQGRWADALELMAAAKEAAGVTGFGVQLLAIAAQELRVVTSLTGAAEPSRAARLADDCRRAGAPAIASFVAAADDNALISRDPSRTPIPAPPAASPEEHCIRAESLALHRIAAGVAPATAWAPAVEAWRQLGHTVWLARAQAAGGDVTSAETTLTAVGAAEEGREWALSAAPTASR